MMNFIASLRDWLGLTYYSNEELLIEAVRNNDIEEARDLLIEGTSINTESETGVTPLLYAIQSGDLQMVEMLIERGADIKKASKTGATPLLYAAQKGRVAVIKALLDGGADANEKHAKTGSTPLIVAAQRDYLVVAEILMEHGADIDATNIIGNTALMTAVKNNYFEMVILLREHGAQVYETEDGPLLTKREFDDATSRIMESFLHKWDFKSGKKRRPAKKAKGKTPDMPKMQQKIHLNMQCAEWI